MIGSIKLETDFDTCLYCDKKATHNLKRTTLFRSSNSPVCIKCGKAKYLYLTEKPKDILKSNKGKLSFKEIFYLSFATVAVTGAFLIVLDGFVRLLS